MNFYIGNGDLKINYNDYNVRFSDDFSEFLYQHRNDLKIDMTWLFALDPYDDDFIPSEAMVIVRESCISLLDNKVLLEYKFVDDAKKMLQDTCNIAEKAMEKGVGLVSIGD